MSTTRSIQPATRSTNQPPGQPLGGSSGDWRYRLLRFHLPLALASAVAFVLFMGLPPFDPQARCPSGWTWAVVLRFSSSQARAE